jgi:hypothetical protein
MEAACLIRGNLKSMYIKCGFHWDLWSIEFQQKLGKEMLINLKPSNNNNSCETAFKATNTITDFIKQNNSE